MDTKKLNLPMAIIIGCLILGGSFYVIQLNKQNSIEKQQLINLQAKREATQLKIEQSNTIQSKTTPQKSATLTIEVCKTQAKDYADKIARAGYLTAAQKALDEGSTESYQMYFNFSLKPEHPADYDSNYNSVYIKCLNN